MKLWVWNWCEARIDNQGNEYEDSQEKQEQNKNQNWTPQYWETFPVRSKSAEGKRSGTLTCLKSDICTLPHTCRKRQLSSAGPQGSEVRVKDNAGACACGSRSLRFVLFWVAGRRRVAGLTGGGVCDSCLEEEEDACVQDEQHNVSNDTNTDDLVNVILLSNDETLWYS